jgi:hypothetical protein
MRILHAFKNKKAVRRSHNSVTTTDIHKGATSLVMLMTPIFSSGFGIAVDYSAKFVPQFVNIET